MDGEKAAADALVQLSTTVNVNLNPTAMLNSSLMFQVSWQEVGDNDCASKSMNRGPNTAKAAVSRQIFDGGLTKMEFAFDGNGALQSWWSVNDPQRLQ